MASFHVALIHNHPRLIQRGPDFDPIIELAIHKRGVFGEPTWRIRVRPAAAVLDRLRQVPVVQRCRWLNAMLQQRVDKPVVKIDAGAINLASSTGQHARPANAKPVSLQPKLAHESYVIDEPAVVIARSVAMLVLVYTSWRMRETMPDAFASAIR